MTRPVIGYVRVSTDKQTETGLSLEEQSEQIKSYCSLYGLELQEIIVDAGSTGRNLKREGVQRLIKLAESDSISGVVISKLDRLTRSLRDLSKLLDTVFERVSLHSVNERLDSSSASGRLCLNVMMSVFTWEVESCSERVRSSLKSKRRRGEALGAAPYGKRWQDGELVDHAEELKKIELIQQLRSEGLTYRKLQTELAARGCTPRRGKRWSLSTLGQICKDTPQLSSRPEPVKPIKPVRRGAAPYGTRWHNGALIIDEREALLLEHIRYLSTIEKISARDICRRLHQQGFKPRRASQWSPRVINNLLSRLEQRNAA